MFWLTIALCLRLAACFGFLVCIRFFAYFGLLWQSAYFALNCFKQECLRKYLPVSAILIIWWWLSTDYVGVLLQIFAGLSCGTSVLIGVSSFCLQLHHTHQLPIANCTKYTTHTKYTTYTTNMPIHANCSNAALAAPCNAMQSTKNFWTEAFASILGLSFHFSIFDPCYWCFAWEPDLIS